MKQMSTDLQKQYEMLRLIVQKMEIHTEADDVDEYGNAAGKADFATGDGSSSAIGWSSPTLRHVMLKQAMMIAKWKKSETE
jgi:hypothetical protein